MIRELSLENFRAFRKLHLAGLGRVNLLVGANNSGKTSVLEGMAFLASGGDPVELNTSLCRRGEKIPGDPAFQSSDEDLPEVRHVFFGRKIGDEANCRIAAIDGEGAVTEVRLSTPAVPDDEKHKWFDAVAGQRRHARHTEPSAVEVDRTGRIPRFLQVISRGGTARLALRLNGGIEPYAIAMAKRIEAIAPVIFVSTSGIDDNALADLYDQFLLTPEEATVVAALAAVEPGIVRLATRKFAWGGRGFIAGMQDGIEQVPLGGLGDGVHRMLAIALALVSARGGYLLIDEIDTGLHHSVMRKMWKLVFETAKRLDVTVFATTHSYDCVHALAGIAKADGTAAGEVSLIRIERDNPEGVHFSEDEISHLAEWQIEAR